MKSEELLMVLNAISERHGKTPPRHARHQHLADYFVATSATSSRQLHAIANSIIEACQKLISTTTGLKAIMTQNGSWLTWATSLSTSSQKMPGPSTT